MTPGPNPKDVDLEKRVFKFIGDPGRYQWRFPLVKGNTYNGHITIHSGETLQTLIDTEDDGEDIKADWEEIKKQNLKPA